KKELMKCEGEKPFEELRWELSPLLWEAVASDSPLRYALRSVTRYGERKVTNALRHYGRRIDKILHYVGTIHSVKGGEATNTFLFDNITKKIYNAMWSDPRPEARVFFVGETRERERQFIVKNFFDTLTYPLEF
ncbi:MAG: hypothetical protein QMC85_07570, partial [Methanocellales archaeon]|nr:hypothetical protein [Methanocellales archaeon]